MFINNKYTNWYIDLISSAQNNPPTVDTYTENHHIIPRCMEGPNTHENLVRLTGKAHYIAHLLLTKMTVGSHKRKMLFALWKMTSSNKNQSRYKITASRYEIIKRDMAIAIREQNTGRIVPEQEKAKARERMAKRNHVPWNKGIKMPEEFGQNIAKLRTGSKSSEETRSKISAGIKKWNMNRVSTPKSLKGRSIPRYTTVLENRITKEIHYVTLLKAWLSERQICVRKFRSGQSDYTVVDRYITRTGRSVLSAAEPAA